MNISIRTKWGSRFLDFSSTGRLKREKKHYNTNEQGCSKSNSRFRSGTYDSWEPQPGTLDVHPKSRCIPSRSLNTGAYRSSYVYEQTENTTQDWTLRPIACVRLRLPPTLTGRVCVPERSLSGAAAVEGIQRRREGLRATARTAYTLRVRTKLDESHFHGRDRYL